MTVQGLIDSVLRLIGVIDSGESPSTSESNHALDALNQLLASWSAAGLPVYQLSSETIPLTGVASYTLATRPVQIKAAQCVNSGVSQDVTPVTAEQWASLRDTTLSGKFATSYLYDAGYPAATIKLWPIPVTGGSLILHTLLPLASLAGLGATISLPPGYEHALRFSLAMVLAPEYGTVLAPEVAAGAQAAQAAIGSLNAGVLGPVRNAMPGAPAPAQ